MKNTSVNVLALKTACLLVLTITLSGCGGGGSTVTIANPANGATLRELASIGGTVTGSSQVEVAIHMQDGDGAWNGSDRWIPTPGPWLAATVTGNNWSAPSAGWQLPSGNTLPNGHYRIMAHPVGSTDEQPAVNITISR